VLDPSNIRPVLACIAVAGALVALFYTARAHKMRDEREKRRRLYCKSGSFAREMPLPDVPKDVRVWSLYLCLACRVSPVLERRYTFYVSPRTLGT
jgi:hypothetical protein